MQTQQTNQLQQSTDNTKNRTTSALQIELIKPEGKSYYNKEYKAQLDYQRLIQENLYKPLESHANQPSGDY